jgi:RNA ligase (TIGR02306 family)
LVATKTWSRQKFPPRGNEEKVVEPMLRKLASVQTVLALEPIPNADAIELARINGWQCVVKKGEFEVGQLGVYFEIDSVPPDTETFRFLWAPKPKEGRDIPDVVERPEKFRIRTMKLRGALSQGLLLPLHSFALGEVAPGTDVSQVLGVEKYEPPIVWSGDVALGPFPGWIPKTDEERVQSAPQVLEELRGRPYVATLKYDGSSATFATGPDGEFVVCGRNYALPEGVGEAWRVAQKLGLKEKMARFPNLAIQGEAVGPGLQKNRLGLKEISLFAFNVYDWRAGRYLDFEESRQVLEEMGVPAVEVVEEGAAFEHSLESLLALAEGKYPGTSNEREGIVIRPKVEARSEVLAGRLSFKAISNRFLLKEGD